MKKLVIIIALLIVSFGTAFPIFNSSGLFPIHDDTQPARVIEMADSIKDGQLPVRWVKELGYGAGYPLFNFYSPLPYYFGAFVYLFSNNAIFATKLMFTAGIIFSSLFMYLLAREFIGDVASFVPTVLYNYNPYHAVEIFVRGSVGEYWAYGLLPLVILSVYKVIKTGSAKWLIIASFSLLSLILSHNITAMIVYVFGLIFLSGLFIKSLLIKSSFKQLKAIALVFVTAILLGAFYVLPAIIETPYTNIASIIQGGSVYSDHFVFLDQLWDSPWGYAGSAPGRADGVTFKIGKLQILLGTIGLLSLFYLHKKNKLDKWLSCLGVWSAVFLLIAVFMTLKESLFIWNFGESFLKYIQFPWRFLIFIELFLSILSIYIFIMIGNKLHSLLVVLAIVVLTVYVNQKYFIPQTFFDYDNSYYESETYKTEIVSLISDEYLPQNFIKINYDNIPTLETGEENIGHVINKRSSTIRDITVDNNVNRDITVYHTYFPGFSVYIDGQEVNSVNKSGRISFRVPQGLHRILVIFKGSLIQVLGNMISCITLIALAFIATKQVKFKL